VEKVMRRHTGISDPDLGDIMEADAWARQEAIGLAGCAQRTFI